MSIENIKKINVRSPYFINVTKDEVADVAPTEPSSTTLTLECGAAASVGTSIGTIKYNIDISGRIIGQYSIALSDITVPIKYRFGYSANMPTYTTAGIDDYSGQWLSATGESPSLSSSESVSATATYTSTQSDIDAYGTTLQLEIQQPMVTDGFSLGLTCPAFAQDAVPIDKGFVVIVSVETTRTSGGLQAKSQYSMNGVALGRLRINALPGQGLVDRYIMSDVSPNLTPVGSSASDTVIESGFYNIDIFKNDTGWFKNSTINSNPNVLNIYKNEDVLNTTLNKFVITHPNTYGSEDFFTLTIGRHPVVDIGGTLHIKSNHDGQNLRLLQVIGRVKPYETLTFEFAGSNATEMSSFSPFAHISVSPDNNIVNSIPSHNINVQAS